MWDIIRELKREGATLLLTTQYLDEADILADQIAVIDNGRVIAEGTADELKLRIGGEMLTFRVIERDKVGAAAGVTLGLGPGGGNADNETGLITIPVGADGTAVLTEAVRRLDDQEIEIADVALRRPSLDDVFLSLTGHVAEQQDEDADEPQDGGRRRRKER